MDDTDRSQVAEGLDTELLYTNYRTSKSTNKSVVVKVESGKRAAVEALAIYKQIRTGPHRVVKVAHAPATDRDITSRSTGLAVTNTDNCACARRNRCLHWHTLGRAPSATG